MFASHGFTEKVANEVLRLLAWPPSRVLVVGAGTGTLLTPLVEASSCLYGIDSSREMARLCRRNGVPCILGDGRQLPAADGGWDTVVITTGVLDCLNDDEARVVLMEAGRVAGPFGQVVATHFDHGPRLGVYERWNLLQEGAVQTDRKIALWRRHRRRADRWGPGLHALCGFFDRGVAMARDAGIEEDRFLAALPAWQRCRRREEIDHLMASAGLGRLSCRTVNSARAMVLVGVPRAAPTASWERIPQLKGGARHALCVS